MERMRAGYVSCQFRRAGPAASLVMMPARVNGKITATQVRLIDDAGGELGVLTLERALDLARSRGEDLVEVGPDDTPPLCQLIDYGKYRWRLQQALEDRKHD